MAGETGGAVRRAASPVEPGQPSADAVVPRRQVRTGPLHMRPLAELDDRPALEARLPVVILLGLGLLVGVQVLLAL